MGQGSKTPADIPEQYRPKMEPGAFSRAFFALVEDNDKRLAREAEALTLHNQSMTAALNGQTSAGGRRLSAAAVAVAASLQQQAEQKKQSDTALDRAAKMALDDMRRRYEEVAAYWDAKADKIEAKLGGLDGIAQKLNVERPKNMTDEEYRRWLNQLILDRVAAGEIDPDDELAEMARARQAAEDARRRAEAELENGNPEQAERVVEEFEQSVLMDRAASAQSSEQLRTMIDIETVQRDDAGEAAMLSMANSSMRDDASVSFFDVDTLVEEPFAETALAMNVTESFNRLAKGEDGAKPISELQVQQMAEFKPVGATNSIG